MAESLGRVEAIALPSWRDSYNVDIVAKTL